jgi:hypothetical protein
MPWETYQAIPPAPPPEPTWADWTGAVAALVLVMAAAVVLSRKHLRRRPPPPPAPDPGQHALRALAAIPPEWPVDRAAAAGARVLRAYLGAVGMGPGLAHPARSFSGLRAADAWRDLTNLLVEMETLSCRPHPPRKDWEDARDLAAGFLKRGGASHPEGGAA